MQLNKVLIASVLKPVDDNRMSRKIGLSVARLPGTEVHVAGFCTQLPSMVEPLHLHPIFCFARLSFMRAWANARLATLALTLKPRLLIIGTHELLPAAAFLKLTLGVKVVYDVRENYYRNIRFTPAFPAPIRLPLAAVVRGLERATSPIVDHYLLAEGSYLREMPFLGHKATVIENKYQPPAGHPLPTVPRKVAASRKVITLLYSGTIALTYGILEAIRLAEALHQLDPRYRLHIIGYAPQADTLKKVLQAIAGKDYIQLTGGHVLVPHPQVVEAIWQADFGLLPYQDNPSTRNCIPTKLYEYLANGLPVLVPNNLLWQGIVQTWRAGLVVDFNQPDVTGLHQNLMQNSYYSRGLPEDVTWASEESKLLQVIRNLLI